MREDFSDQHWEWFQFGNVKSNDYGVWISGEATFNAPERDVEVIEVPGRNGTLSIDNGRWKNVTIKYPCYMSGDFKEGFDAFKNAVLSQYGYQTLTDTYHPYGYRKARITKGIQPKPGPYNRSAQFDLTFDCWPQFYLTQRTVVDGTLFPTQINVSSSPKTISDIPLASYSQPVVQVWFDNILQHGNRSGTVTIGDSTITFTDMPFSGGDVYFVIDSENKTITHTSGGVKSDFSEYCTVSGGFFEIVPPSTVVSFSGNVASLRVYPRWWQL